MTYALSHELNQQSLAFLNESQSGHKHAKKKKSPDCYPVAVTAERMRYGGPSGALVGCSTSKRDALWPDMWRHRGWGWGGAEPPKKASYPWTPLSLLASFKKLMARFCRLKFPGWQSVAVINEHRRAISFCAKKTNAPRGRKTGEEKKYRRGNYRSPRDDNIVSAPLKTPAKIPAIIPRGKRLEGDIRGICTNRKLFGSSACYIRSDLARGRVGIHYKSTDYRNRGLC